MLKQEIVDKKAMLEHTTCGSSRSFQYTDLGKMNMGTTKIYERFPGHYENLSHPKQ